MSWQLASLIVLALALAGGFAWYERSRPPAKVLALVAALAALAVVGRLAFAAFPNVKPTTDIVLLAGYALGGVPGFAVGAVTALASNVFLSQGPWTPWQMAAWGGVGVAGAGLARLAGGRDIGRVPLALFCGLAGFAFGAIMDTYQWTFAAEQTAASWIAISATSLPYNVAHAVGNVFFCLVIGPAFLRTLRRYRRRFEVRWEPPAASPSPAVLAAAIVALAFAAGALAPAPAQADRATDRAVTYLKRSQGLDGGFGPAPKAGSTQIHTGWASLGLASARVNPSDVRRAKRSAIDYTRTHARTLNEIGELERTILVLVAAGESPRSFARKNFVADLVRRQDADGSFDDFNSYTAFGILALKAAGGNQSALRKASRWLVRQQNDDGGFGVGRGAASDVDNTGAVLQALAATGRGKTDDALDAVRYLRRAQNADGGFGQTQGRSSNAQSTAYAVQGLIAVGRNPERLRKGRRTPLGYLRSLQAGNGMVRYSRTSSQTPVWVTAQALMALSRKALPLAAVPRRRVRPAAGAKAAPVARVTSNRKKPAKKTAPAKPKRKKVPRSTVPAAERKTEPAGRELPAVTVEPARRTAAPAAAAKADDSLVPGMIAAAVALAAIAWFARRRWTRRARGA